MTWTLEERTAALELAVAKIEERLETISMELRDHKYDAVVERGKQ